MLGLSAGLFDMEHQLCWFRFDLLPLHGPAQLCVKKL